MSPRSREEIAELIAEWIADLNDLEGTPLIVVEGKRDRSALSELGISTEATSLNLGLTILELAGSIREGKGPFEGRRYDRAIILTD